MMNAEQKYAFERIAEGHSAVILGQGGTGKSYIVKEIYDLLRLREKRVFITCSTGIACTLYTDAVTLHSWAGILDGRYSHMKTLQRIQNDEKFKNTLKNIQECDCLVIDEISMISKNIFEKVEFICRNVRKNDCVFGGIQVVGSGDFFQLSPVPNLLYGDSGKSCLESELFIKTFPHKFILTEVMRQDEKDLIKAVNELEKGNLTNDSEILLESLKRPLPSSQSPVYLYARNFYADLHNYEVLTKMDGEFSIYNSRDNGDKHYLNKMIIQEKLALKENCRVILLKNLGNNLMNGMIGNVLKLNDDTIIVQIDDKPCTIARQNFTVYDPITNKLLAERYQFPLKPCYAMTIHKSQGMTLNSVVVNCSKASIPGQIGVAVGRVKSKDGLQVINFHPSLVKRHPIYIYDYYDSDSSPIKEDKSCCQESVFNHDILIEFSEDFDDDSSESGDENNFFQQYNFSDSDIEELLHEDEEEHMPDEMPFVVDDILRASFSSFTGTPAEDSVSKLVDKMNNSTREISLWMLHIFSYIDELCSKHLTSPATKNMTEFCAEINRYMQNDEYLQGCKSLLKSYTTQLEDSHYSFLTACVFQCQRIVISKQKDTVLQEMSSSQTHDKPVTSSVGLGKLRYVCGYCIAKAKYSMKKTLSSCMYNLKRQEEYLHFRKKLQLIEVMEVEYFRLLETTKYPDTLSETQRKQNVSGGLTNVSDECFDFFVLVEKLYESKLVKENVSAHGENLIQHMYTVIMSDPEITDSWQKIYSEQQLDPSCYIILIELKADILKRFLNVVSSQFIRDFKLEVKRTKSSAHRKKVMEKSEKASKSSYIVFKDMLSDKSQNKEASHMALKLNLIKNPNVFEDRKFTKDHLCMISRAYGLSVAKKMKKNDIASQLSPKVLSSSSMPFPHLLQGPLEDKQTDIESQTSAEASRESQILDSGRDTQPGPSRIQDRTPFTGSSAPTNQTSTVVQARPSKRKRKGKGKGKSTKKREAETETGESCSICFTMDSDKYKWIQCDICDGWYCENCAEITDWEYYEEDDVEFHCKLCMLN